MKKICLTLLFLICSVLIVGCANNPPSEDAPPTFSVEIKLNDDSMGEIIIDNIKTKYESGDVINITVVPNEGYYLRSYSDTTEILYDRQIIVDKDMSILVTLKEGESCNFYGYKIARNSNTNFNGLTHRFSPNKDSYTISDLITGKVYDCGYSGTEGGGLVIPGDLLDPVLYEYQSVKEHNYPKYEKGDLLLSKTSEDSFLYFKNSANPIFIDKTSISEYTLFKLFGEPNENEWIDIVEYHYNPVGVVFSISNSAIGEENLPNEYSSVEYEMMVVEPQKFVDTNENLYFYINDNKINHNFKSNEFKTSSIFYTQIIEKSQSVEVLLRHLIEINGQVYYGNSFYTAIRPPRDLNLNDIIKSYTYNFTLKEMKEPIEKVSHCFTGKTCYCDGQNVGQFCKMFEYPPREIHRTVKLNNEEYEIYIGMDEYLDELEQNSSKGIFLRIKKIEQ